MRRPQQGLECLADAERAVCGMGWALAIPISGRWEGGRVLYRVPPSHPVPGIPHPWYPHSRTTPLVHVRHAGTDVLDSSFEAVQGDPRGVKRAGVGQGTLGAVSALPPPYAPSSPAPPWRLLLQHLSISQYISVYLSILGYSQYIPVFYDILSILGYSQYFSVFLSI